jgi:hypothetical protein
MNVTPQLAQNKATTKTGKQRKTIVDDATAAGEAYRRSGAK